MKGSRFHPRTRGHADHHIGILPPAIMYLSQVIDDLIEPAGNKIGKLHLYYRFKTVYRKSQCSAYNCRFTQGGVAHPFFAKLPDKALCNLKDTAISGNILSH